MICFVVVIIIAAGGLAVVVGMGMRWRESRRVGGIERCVGVRCVLMDFCEASRGGGGEWSEVDGFGWMEAVWRIRRGWGGGGRRC